MCVCVCVCVGGYRQCPALTHSLILALSLSPWLSFWHPFWHTRALSLSLSFSLARSLYPFVRSLARARTLSCPHFRCSFLTRLPLFRARFRYFAPSTPPSLAHSAFSLSLCPLLPLVPTRLLVCVCNLFLSRALCPPRALSPSFYLSVSWDKKSACEFLARGLLGWRHTRVKICRYVMCNVTHT